jgi:hypothetical protein
LWNVIGAGYISHLIERPPAEPVRDMLGRSSSPHETNGIFSVSDRDIADHDDLWIDGREFTLDSGNSNRAYLDFTGNLVTVDFTWSGKELYAEIIDNFYSVPSEEVWNLIGSGYIVHATE